MTTISNMETLKINIQKMADDLVNLKEDDGVNDLDP